MTKARIKGDYAVARRERYGPASIVDFIDAFWHERNGDPKPMQVYLEHVGRVKREVPKPVRVTKANDGKAE